MTQPLLQRIRKKIGKQRPSRVAFYTRNFARDLSPQFIFRNRLARLLKRAHAYDPDYMSTRINYYNKLVSGALLGDDTGAVNDISFDRSFYYYDLKEHARYFPRHFRFHYLFGDVTIVPDVPCIVKSRPIGEHNQNSAIMKLEKLRHFFIPPDSTRFEDKKPLAVWRGSDHNPKRVELMRHYHGHALCDIGLTNVPEDDPRRGSFLNPSDQMGYKYIISIEGIDVATNLKWILASNSLCLMPDSVYETWFMEGRLVDGKQFVRVADDFADLEDKILHYEKHPEEAREIIRNANAYVAQFLEPEREQILSLLVLYKYFVVTGQIEPDPDLAALISV